MPWCISGGQKTTWKGLFTSSITWVLGIELRSSGLAANASISPASHKPHKLFPMELSSSLFVSLCLYYTLLGFSGYYLHADLWSLRRRSSSALKL